MSFQVEYSVDAPPQDIDETVKLAREAEPDQPLRLRLQPQVYIKTGNQKGTYLAWRGVFWNLKLATVEDAQAFREAIVSFFRALNAFGAGNLKLRLDMLLSAVPESGVDASRILPIAESDESEFDRE